MRHACLSLVLVATDIMPGGSVSQWSYHQHTPSWHDTVHKGVLYALCCNPFCTIRLWLPPGAAVTVVPDESESSNHCYWQPCNIKMCQDSGQSN